MNAIPQSGYIHCDLKVLTQEMLHLRHEDEMAHTECAALFARYQHLYC